MLSLNNDFRKNIAKRLDEITLFKEYRGSGNLCIEERDNVNKKNKEEILLRKIQINDLSNKTMWVFNHEFTHEQFTKESIQQTQKSSLTAAGDKVEKTIIFYDSTKHCFYVCMIEMKTTLSLENISDVKSKYEHALNFLSIFIAANPSFTERDNAKLYPITICCFNNDNNAKDVNKSTHSTSIKRIFQNEYIKTKNTTFLIKIESLVLGILDKTPLVLYKNPNQAPITEKFDIDFNDIIQRATTISVAPKPPKTTIFQ